MIEHILQAKSLNAWAEPSRDTVAADSATSSNFVPLVIPHTPIRHECPLNQVRFKPAERRILSQALFKRIVIDDDERVTYVLTDAVADVLAHLNAEVPDDLTPETNLPRDHAGQVSTFPKCGTVFLACKRVAEGASSYSLLRSG
ncbi:hypothetical protein HD598_001815 [Neomicrococcus aestuarii]|uniref:Uncharacterized protein n=1 Tax=Neomicrococcus aestuarii TaxID=556325 RepID=A0A7W8TUQ0_9MICC|nr:hypothetical protein [Neomicrococcus aestuarii]MBB5513128.1 hypothetical protein [Neomicrococcus aestuarii]